MKPVKPIKLEEFLASQTAYSRRKILDLLNAGEVSVNGVPVTSLSHPVQPKTDQIKVGTVKIEHEIPYMYYKFNKPKDVICTLHDPKGRRDLMEFLRPFPQSLTPVGRLDRQTKGLLLFTNDGEFANRLMHPRYGVSKLYTVTLDQAPTARHLERLTEGMMLEDGPIRFSSIEIVDNKILKVSLKEGRNRIVRRTFDHLGYTVEKLKRIAIGPILLGKLAEGDMQPLSSGELRTLKTQLGLTK